MATSAMLWGGAGPVQQRHLPFKRYILGRGVTREGQGDRLTNPVVPDASRVEGNLPSVTAMPAWETIRRQTECSASSSAAAR